MLSPTIRTGQLSWRWCPPLLIVAIICFCGEAAFPQPNSFAPQPSFSPTQLQQSHSENLQQAEQAILKLAQLGGSPSSDWSTRLLGERDSVRNDFLRFLRPVSVLTNILKRSLSGCAEFAFVLGMLRGEEWTGRTVDAGQGSAAAPGAPSAPSALPAQAESGAPRAHSGAASGGSSPHPELDQKLASELAQFFWSFIGSTSDPSDGPSSPPTISSAPSPSSDGGVIISSSRSDEDTSSSSTPLHACSALLRTVLESAKNSSLFRLDALLAVDAVVEASVTRASASWHRAGSMEAGGAAYLDRLGARDGYPSGNMEFRLALGAVRSASAKQLADAFFPVAVGTGMQTEDPTFPSSYRKCSPSQGFM